MLSTLGARTRERLVSVEPWTNVYGLARTCIALGTLGTLALSRATSIFKPSFIDTAVPHCSGATNLSFFCVAGPRHLEFAPWIGVVLLLVVASGWRPRYTGVVHGGFQPVFR